MRLIGVKLQILLKNIIPLNHELPKILCAFQFVTIHQ